MPQLYRYAGQKNAQKINELKENPAVWTNQSDPNQQAQDNWLMEAGGNHGEARTFPVSIDSSEGLEDLVRSAQLAGSANINGEQAL
jgi:hypothetical protein